MDKYLIMGYGPYAGDYDGVPYSGMRVYVQRLDIDAQAGIACDVIKLKSKVLENSPIVFTPDIVGKMIGVYYNKYGQISSAEIFDDVR